MTNYFKSSIKSMERLNFNTEEIAEDKPSKMVCMSHKNDKNALANYSSWLQKRHETHLKLNKKTHRGCGDLLMNMGDELNEVKEEKAALEYTRIPQKFDKYRGNPARWIFAPGLHDKCTCRPDKVKYFYQKTKEQKNEIPEIERVGLSHHIQSEKLLLPRTRNMYEMWRNLDFRKKKVEELDYLLQNITPHKPIFDNLIVLGNKIHPPEEQLEKTELHVQTSTDCDKKQNTSIYDLSLRICLKVNGVYLYENSPNVATSKKFYVLFEYDVQSFPLHTRYITFENIGRVTLRIYWTEMKKFRLFRNMNKRINSESFCFDKNVLVLVPGQILNFPIWFQTRKVCTVVESWEISTVPKFWKDTVKVFFVLQAQTHIENFTKRIRNIKANINHTVKRRIIKELLEEAMEKIKYENYRTIKYSYYEPELFESLNFDDADVERKPRYLFDKFIVGQLKEFYAEVRQEFHPKTWNLNIEHLKTVTRVKDLIEYAEERTRHYSLYRIMMADQQFDIPTDKNMKVISNHQLKTKQKKVSIESRDNNGQTLSQFVHLETRYGTLMKLLSKLVAPSITPNVERLKYFHVYSILCSYFTDMSIELYNLKLFNKQSSTFVKNSRGNCQRLIFEKFDELQLVHTKRALNEDNKAQPKPFFLKEVSSDDVYNTHRLYFKRQSQVISKTSTKAIQVKITDKKKKETPNRSKIDQFSSNSSKTDLVDDKLTISNFDPYSEDNTQINLRKFDEVSSLTIIPSDEYGSTSTVNSGFVPSAEVQTFNIYLTVYTHLQQAIDAVVDCLESENEHKVPHENLDRLKSCFSLFIEDETTAPEVPSINPFEDVADRQYYEKLLRAHLNDVTGQYLVCGKTISSPEPHLQGSVWGTLESDLAVQPYKPQQVEKTASVFTLPKIKPDEVTYQERSAQVREDLISCEGESVHKISQSSREICEQLSGLGEFTATDVSEEFYYCDDDVSSYIDHDFSSTAKTSEIPSVVVTSHASQDEMASDKEATKPKTAISVLKEYTKRKCSIDDIDDI